MPSCPGSTAINAGTLTSAPSTDQRGIVRSDGAIDIGAFESRGFAIVPTNGNNQSTCPQQRLQSPRCHRQQCLWRTCEWRRCQLQRPDHRSQHHRHQPNRLDRQWTSQRD